MVTYTSNKYYPYQLWLTSIGIAPIMAIIFFGEGEFGYLFLFLLLALAYSLPTLLVCVVAFRFFIHKISSGIMIKVLLNLISITGVFLTFQIISGSIILELSLIYSVAIIVSSLLYKIYRKEETNIEVEPAKL